MTINCIAPGLIGSKRACKYSDEGVYVFCRGSIAFKYFDTTNRCRSLFTPPPPHHVILEQARYFQRALFGDPVQSTYRKKSIAPSAHLALDPQTAMRSFARTRFEDDGRD